MSSLADMFRWSAYSFSSLCSAAVNSNCILCVRLSRAGFGGRPPFGFFGIAQIASVVIMSIRTSDSNCGLLFLWPEYLFDDLIHDHRRDPVLDQTLNCLI